MIVLYSSFAVILAAVLAFLLWPARHQHRFVAVVCALFILGALTGYRLFGAPEIVALLGQRQEKIDEVKTAIVRYSREIKAHPKNLGAWVALGRNFIDAGQFEAAANAFKQAVKLSGGEPHIILAYAQAQIFAAGGTIDNDAKKSLEMVLVQDPENPEARYFLALRLLQDGQTQKAMKAMKELYRSLPEGSPLKTMIDRQIEK